VSLWRTLLTALRLGRALAPVQPAPEQPMKLIVGLGNPGRQYVETRHNIGYRVIERLAERFGPVRFRSQFSGRTAGVSVAGQRVMLLEPQTYMNLSGQSVQPALAFYKLTPAELLVICDDLNLPVGKIRIRRGGSDGGQKGLRSIGQALAATDYPRLRVGIGSPAPGRDAADYVLSRFSPEERKLIDEAVDRAADAVAVWCKDGIEACMNRFN
jgi:PTH1 family peptidyl-tRNA hydrolase